MIVLVARARRTNTHIVSLTCYQLAAVCAYASARYPSMSYCYMILREVCVCVSFISHIHTHIDALDNDPHIDGAAHSIRPIERHERVPHTPSQSTTNGIKASTQLLSIFVI